MRFLALDLAGVVGWAAADGRGEPIHGTKRLPKTEVGFGPYMRVYADWLEGLILSYEPHLVTYESPILPKRKANIHTLRGLYSLTTRCEEICDRKKIRCTEGIIGEVRTHFLGAGNTPGERPEIKDAVIAQCRRRGWAPEDDNAADALALLDYVRACRIPGWANQGLPLLGNR